jgi:hypothetical protein
MVTGDFPRGEFGLGLKLTAYLHIVARLRMSGTIPPFPPYAFVACPGTAYLYFTVTTAMLL